MNTPICKRCNVPMIEGIALINGLTGLPDFPKDNNVCTVSPDPKKIKLIPCWKCPNCGHSISK